MNDEHAAGDMALAAACYAYQIVEAYEQRAHQTPIEGPWADDWWKPKDPRRDLVRSGALIVAEIERRKHEAAQIRAGPAAHLTDRKGPSGGVRKSNLTETRENTE